MTHRVHEQRVHLRMAYVERRLRRLEDELRSLVSLLKAVAGGSAGPRRVPVRRRQPVVRRAGR
jgi:hypothetical protein